MREGGAILKPTLAKVKGGNIMKNTLKKQTSHAFGKDVYLLGNNADGVAYWLEAPKWDCEWYWGFGYVETYTNNRRPDKAKDIASHQHIDSSFMGSVEVYDTDKQVWKKGEYIHNIYDSPKFVNTTFSEKEGWTLSELFATFYHLRKSAEFFAKGGMHLITNPLASSLRDEKLAKKINEELIPAITSKIIQILSPED